jgi:membrane dipeptidase
VSHGSDETISQAIDASTDPVLATHHGLRSVNNISRLMPDDLLKKLAAKGGVMGFQIGNEFHNVKVFNWNTEHAGKPFWDTTDIGRKEAGMTIEELDRLAAPQFPMWGRGPGRPQATRTNGRRHDRAIAGRRGSRHARIDSTADPRCHEGFATSAVPMITEAILKRGCRAAHQEVLGGTSARGCIIPALI